VDVVILAGGRCKEDLRNLSGEDWRCDLTLYGRTFLDITLDAVEGLGEVVIVGPHGSRGLAPAPPGDSFVGSVQAGLDRVTSEDCLIVTCDMPWISREAVAGFMERVPEGAEIGYPIVRVEDCEARFPSLSRTAVRVKEGRFTGGNLAWVRTEPMRRAVKVLDRAYQARKSPLALAGLVGWDLVVRLAWSKAAPSSLSLDWVEQRISRFLGAEARAVPCPFPEIGTDIDSADQYKVMLELQKSAR
jgi:CTP:molybdopterin cytidylyltransferase MocA